MTDPDRYELTYNTCYAVWALTCGCIRGDITIDLPTTNTTRDLRPHPTTNHPTTPGTGHIYLRLTHGPPTHIHGEPLHQILTRPAAKPPKRTDLTLRPRDAARRLRTTDKQLARWADLGYFTVRRTPGGHRRYSVSEVNEWLAADSVALFRAPRAHPVPVEVAGQLAVPAAAEL